MPTIYGNAQGNVVFELEYDNIVQASQTAIWNFVRTYFQNTSDTSIKTKNVFDRIPEDLTQGIGYPYIIVPYPEVRESLFTFTEKKVEVVFKIEVWFKGFSARRLIDAVRTCLNNREEFCSGRLRMAKFVQPDSAYDVISLDNNDVVNRYVFTVIYDWTGLPP